MSKKVHFIAIGGSAMHNLAIALKIKGYDVTGSDDEIFDPARTNLSKHGILPDNVGWFSDKIDNSIDEIILGMHAKGDNPELQKAKELGIPIYSFPEYIYKQSLDKTRVVIGGSHGKTTITAMILHVLNKLNIDVDYLVGAKLEGYEVMVKLTTDNKYIVLEGDEYLTSAMDKRPKFHVYKPDIAVVSGIAWDHANVFKTFEDYLRQFEIFMRLVPENGTLIYCNDDENIAKLIENNDFACRNIISYNLPKHKVSNGKTTIISDSGNQYQISVFGKHNLLNIEAAKNVCSQLGVREEQFYNAISDFKGALNRLQKVYENSQSVVYKDFAHSPSKLMATLNAVKEQYPERRLIACFELHTYSSLSKEFLVNYKNTMQKADVALVYFSPHALQLKRLPDLDAEYVKEQFGRNDLNVVTNPTDLKQFLLNQNYNNTNLLMMSSGNWDGLKIEEVFSH
ncbi:MAG: UDP-N-acetylmuramate--L-alanine ligase [Bacteroidales bacterium]|jgi:UDP-N-acetylmuramate: L-alanyl-gamma-D-glutamyl-meso-diaminopimelate ligase